MIHAANVPLGGELNGFYTTRWVQALNPKRAEYKAVALVKRQMVADVSEEALKKSDARMFVEEIEKVDHFPRFRGGGVVWYPMDDER